MKTGISWKIVMTGGLALLLATTPASAGGRGPEQSLFPKLATFKVRTDQKANNGHTAPKHVAHKPAQPAQKPKPNYVPDDVPGAPPELSPDAALVVRLYKSGFNRDDLLHYVNRSHADYKMSLSSFNHM